LGSGGTGIKTINLGGSAANVITVGNGQTAGSITIGGSLTTGTIFLGASATTTAETGIIDIGYGDGVDTINIGSYTTGAKTITLGSTAASSTTTINGATTSLTGATIKMTTLTAGTGYWLCDSSGTILEDNGTACTSSSSETMKHNIQTMGDVLPDLSALNPVTFDWNSGYQASNGGSYDMGFIAEQVQSIFPELVSTDSSGQVTGLNYLGLIPIAIKAAQEEEQQITTEQSDIALIQSSIQNGVLNVNGANIQGNTNIGGSLNVSGPTSLSDLTVSGTATTQELVVNDKATINNLQITGSAEFDGNINLAATVNTEQAITKQFIASGPIAAGSVVILDPTQNGYVTTTTDFEDTRIIGVAVDTANNAGDVIKVAIGGSVQVQADPFTAVASGDIMVSDVNAGKATADTNPKIGSILGKATSAPDANNLVWVLITLE
jgi:hypothetical protein